MNGEEGESLNGNTCLNKVDIKKDKWGMRQSKRSRMLEVCIKIDKRTQRENGDRELK